MKELIGAAMDAGLYLSSFSNVVRLTPPLIITPDELRLGVELLDARARPRRRAGGTTRGAA